MHILITGAAGFIGFHLAKHRLEKGDIVFAMDNLNDYYDVGLKKARLQCLAAYPNFHFYEADLCDSNALNKIFRTHKPQTVVNLAAQAGVRYSLTNPQAYVQSNMVGFSHLIEACRIHNVEHLVYASTSSVYGSTEKQPFQESDATNHPLTIYAASKKANELMAHSYSHLYQLPTTGLRFFTVYGPWGRPDMAFFSFTRDILAGKTIKIYNQGKMQRDFTYIDDLVAGISLAIDKEIKEELSPKAATHSAPYYLYNLGSGRTINLLDYIHAIEQATGKIADKEFLPMQNGDVPSTHADIQQAERELGYLPQITFQEGITRFVAWYLDFYHKKI